MSITARFCRYLAMNDAERLIASLAVMHCWARDVIGFIYKKRQASFLSSSKTSLANEG